jgi:hypothetical protein
MDQHDGGCAVEQQYDVAGQFVPPLDPVLGEDAREPLLEALLVPGAGLHGGMAGRRGKLGDRAQEAAAPPARVARRLAEFQEQAGRPRVLGSQQASGRRDRASAGPGIADRRRRDRPCRGSDSRASSWSRPPSPQPRPRSPSECPLHRTGAPRPGRCGLSLNMRISAWVQSILTSEYTQSAVLA